MHDRGLGLLSGQRKLVKPSQSFGATEHKHMGSAQALDESGTMERPEGDPSVSSSLEHLIAGSQGVITKRVDLALLEAQEMLSRIVEQAAVASVAVLLAAGTWFAFGAAFVLLVAPDADLLLQLTAFGLINAAGTLLLRKFVQSYGLPIRVEEPNGRGRPSTPDPSTPVTRT
jgi:uncharacterized membrane protein YqjE